MGAWCSHRRAPRAEPQPRPPEARGTDLYRQRALQSLRTKFGRAWRICGQWKKIQATGDPEAKWAKMVEHKLYQHDFHNMSMLLAEIKRNKRAERP